jgi:hypothetical protein
VKIFFRQNEIPRRELQQNSHDSGYHYYIISYLVGCCRIRIKTADSILSEAFFSLTSKNAGC